MLSTAIKARVQPNDAAALRRFDGIICFGGEDWWYHNRGHYDMQLMDRLSQDMPVLYVNSIGMRTPSPAEGRMFLNRIRRKLRSMRRGLVEVSRNFAVFSPPCAPGRAGMAAGRKLLARAVRRAARKRGIKRPLLWVACPTAAEVVEDLDPQAVVYQRTDRYECFKGVSASRIGNYDGWLKARADLTIFCSTTLYQREADGCRRAACIDHGVDLERFVSASEGAPTEPLDIAALPRPRVGFVGGIDAHTFDADLFVEAARALPEAQFVLVGACSLPDGWCGLPNVILLGKRPYEDVPAYMAACDVLIMPWQRSPWIEACNPVKLKEYLAAGRPVVSTDFPELRRYEGLVRTADAPEAFADAIRDALVEPWDARPVRERLSDQSWSSKADAVLGELESAGVVPRRPRRAAVCGASTRPAPAAPAAWQPRIAGDPAPVAVTEPMDEGSTARVDLAASILLAGGLRPSPLAAAAGRSVLDLWPAADQTVLDFWLDRIAEVAGELSRVVPVRIVHDARTPPPWPRRGLGAHVIIEQEPRPLRGPAGLLRDMCRDYGARDHVLVAESARLPACALGPMLADHARHAADVTVAANPDHSPAGVYLVRCGVLDLVPASGFCDLKEQWLPRAVDAGLSVRVHDLKAPGTLPLRTRRQFLDAALPDGSRVVCPGGLIGPGASVVGSIVMPGAVVGPGATVVRSLLCPDSKVRAGANIVDAVVYGGQCVSDDRSVCAITT
ncbi:MAG: glycosyltransferase [Planctomycetota bacterium]|jgi:glycosyltransferase involved in cell wall biosynthesis